MIKESCQCLVYLKKNVRFKLLIRHRSNKIFRFGQENRRGVVKLLSGENQYEKLAQVVEPLACKSYENQLGLKQHLIERCMTKVVNILKDERRLDPANHQFVNTMITEHGNKMCPVEDIIPSPVIEGYRNKNGLSIGTDIMGNNRTVGLTVGRHNDGSATCVQIYHIKVIKERHKEICRAVQDFINQSSYEPLKNRQGHWKEIIIRSTTTGQTMLILRFHPQRNSEEFVNGAKNEILQYFLYGPGKNLDLNSIYFQSSHLRYAFNEQFPYQLLHGDPILLENLSDLKFQISPESFFQGNTPCAEMLYSKALDLGNIGSETTVLDVCCGTGTIGILAAKRAKRVVGVEIMQQAVDDARLNAQINGITNTEFICNKAHRLIRDIEQNKILQDEDNVVAVLNPGSVGVNKNLIISLRNCPKIQKVIYISCKPVGNVLSNFCNLMTPSDEIYIGEPFKAIVAVPVDMFPQTLHCELIVLFER